MISGLDVLVALKLAANRDQKLRQMDIAHSIGVSQSSVHESLKRLYSHRLFSRSRQTANVLTLHEFLAYGARYLFSTGQTDRTAIGMPTAWAAAPLDDIIAYAGEPPVWPSKLDQVAGFVAAPIYPTVPFAASQDPALYELLALIDGLRFGRAREINYSREMLKARLIGA